MVNTVFSKMDIYMAMRQGSGGASSDALDLQKLERNSLERSLNRRPTEESKDDSAATGQTSQRGSINRNITASAEVAFSVGDQYMHSLVTMMVDFVSLHDARV